jgi:hypothetical protein
MPFTLPDQDEAFHDNQATWMQTDINTLVMGIEGDGVISGCAVTAQGTPDMTVAVASGEVRVNDKIATVTSGNVTITTADPSNPRIDLVVVNDSGTKSVTAGTPGAQPKAPDIPANSVLLAMVYVPANDTTIATNQITDKRVIVSGYDDMLQFVIDGGGVAITTGEKGYLVVPFNCKVIEWVILADQTGSIVVNVWKDTYANFPPTSGDGIAGSEKPTLSSARKNQDTSLTTWTTALSRGDIIAFNVDSATTVTRVTVGLRVKRV